MRGGHCPPKQSLRGHVPLVLIWFRCLCCVNPTSFYIPLFILIVFIHPDNNIIIRHQFYCLVHLHLLAILHYRTELYTSSTNAVLYMTP